MIKVHSIKKRFGSLDVLKGIDLHISKSEVAAIVGASGAGKTTLLQIIGTLLPPDEGSVFIDGTDINKLSAKELAVFRNRKIGFVFQFHYLLPEFTALENVMLPGFIAGYSRSETEKKAQDLLKLLNMSQRLQHKPAALSGGEQQRVAIARAMINNPAVILADEPSGNLDSKNRAELQNLFFRVRDLTGQTILVVTHDEHFADLCDRKIEMQDGLILSDTIKAEKVLPDEDVVTAAS